MAEQKGASGLYSQDLWHPVRVKVSVRVTATIESTYAIGPVVC